MSAATSSTSSPRSLRIASSCRSASRTAGHSGGRGTAQSTTSSALNSEQIEDWIRDAAGIPDLPVEIERASVFGYGIGLAERFRDGDAFLIGDAAHRVTPRGATGLNTAIRDGFDIGWKLAWVLRGWAAPSLLESYERERRPVAEFNTQRSTRADGSILGNSIGLNADIGGRIAHVWVPRGEGLVSTARPTGRRTDAFCRAELGQCRAHQPVRLTTGNCGATGRDRRPRPRPDAGGLAASQARRLRGSALERRRVGPGPTERGWGDLITRRLRRSRRAALGTPARSDGTPRRTPCSAPSRARRGCRTRRRNCGTPRCTLSAWRRLRLRQSLFGG